MQVLLSSIIQITSGTAPGTTHIQTYIGHSQTLAGAACTLDRIQVKSLSRCTGLYNCWLGTSPDLEVLCLQSAPWSCQSAPGRTCWRHSSRWNLTGPAPIHVKIYCCEFRCTLKYWCPRPLPPRRFEIDCLDRVVWGVLKLVRPKCDVWCIS